MLEKAYEFAAQAHKGQVRKGTDVPYIVHPVEVSEILGELGCGEEVITAGLLHDTLEDTRATVQEITERFGEDVAKLVAFNSEDKSLPWEDRKTHTLKSLENAEPEQMLLVFADKLSNIRSMRKDYAAAGEELWKRFNRGYDKQKRMFVLYDEFFRAAGKTGSAGYRRMAEEFSGHCAYLFGPR